MKNVFTQIESFTGSHKAVFTPITGLTVSYEKDIIEVLNWDVRHSGKTYNEVKTFYIDNKYCSMIHFR